MKRLLFVGCLLAALFGAGLGLVLEMDPSTEAAPPVAPLLSSTMAAPPAGPVRVVVVEGRQDPVGFHQYTDLSSSTDLTDGGTYTIPARAHAVWLQVDTQNMRWRDFPSTAGDTTDPTATVGMQVIAGRDVFYAGNLYDFEMIEEVSGAVVNASFYAY